MHTMHAHTYTHTRVCTHTPTYTHTHPRTPEQDPRTSPSATCLPGAIPSLLGPQPPFPLLRRTFLTDCPWLSHDIALHTTANEPANSLPGCGALAGKHPLWRFAFSLHFWGLLFNPARNSHGTSVPSTGFPQSWGHYRTHDVRQTAYD